MTIMNQLATAIFPDNGCQIYVSQKIGNDSNTGSYTSPLATFGAGITLANTFSPPLVIIGLDQESYDEQLTLVQNIIYAPQAAIQSSTGDTFTVNGSAIINVKSMGSSTGNVVNIIGGEATINFQECLVGNFVNNGGRQLVLVGDLLSAAAITNPSGTTYLQIAQPLASVTYDSGVSGYAAGVLIGPMNISGLNYPAADGTAGQAVVTDGSGNLSFATIGGIATVVVTGTTQSAVVNTNYVITNTGLTVVTLPATMNPGDIIKITGVGVSSGGCQLLANTGQTINLGTSTTSSGGSLTSSVGSDIWQVSCVVANTTWTVDYLYSAGLTVA